MTPAEFEESGYREHIVTLNSIEDSEEFYNDMETEGGSIYIPERVVDCANRRPISRNTHYWITDDEAKKIKKDPRVIDITLHPRYLGIEAGTFSISQYSNRWNKSGSTDNTMKNWALLRCTETDNRVGWGGYPNETGTIYLSQIGRNVDIVVVDDSGLSINHPEFAVNTDGTGGSRAVPLNWFQYNPQVTGSPSGTYSYGNGSHNIHVEGTCAGNTQGWARGANVYNIYYYTNNDTDFAACFDYVRYWHRNKSINPSTGRRNPTVCNNSWGQSLFPGQWAYADITAVTYRGIRYTPSGTTTYLGQNGVYTDNTKIMGLPSLETGGNRIITTGATTGTVSSLSFIFNSTSTLTASTTPTVGTNDDGYWTISLPFNITFFGTSYSTVYLGTNGYLTFSGGSAAYTGLSASNPLLPKIMWGADDNSIQRMYYGSIGTAPNRLFSIKVEASGNFTGILGNPTMTYEYVFYENSPNQIDLQCGITNRKSTGAFDSATLQAWGFYNDGQVRIPQRVSALDADLEDAIKDGIIIVGAAGNGYWKHAAPGDQDWDNSFEMGNRYPASASTPYYYMKGTSPTANDSKETGGNYDIPNICVGSIDVNAIDEKAYYSDCGPGVDIWAPGTQIMSTYTSGVGDPRNVSYYLAKNSGTSMASPQVTGVIACLLELYPHWTQRQVKAYITGIAQSNKIVASSGGPTDYRDLQGAPNLFLYYKKERPDEGQTVPKIDNGLRPTVGQVWPRPRTYIYR